MKTFIVKIREVHTQDVLVQAEDAESAKDLLYEDYNLDAQYIDGSLEFSHRMEPETWTVEEVPEITNFVCRDCGWEESDPAEHYGLVVLDDDRYAADAACPRCSEKKSGSGYLRMIAHNDKGNTVRYI